MKILIFLLNFLCVVAMGQVAIRPTITMPANPPANVAEWAQPFIISAMIQQGTPNDIKSDECKMVISIKSDGKPVCGKYTSTNAPYYKFHSIVMSIYKEEILSHLGECVLKPGQYELCVEFFGFNNRVMGSSCKPFTIADNKPENYTPPTLISPAEGKVLSETEQKQPINFRWTPHVPRPRESITYKVTMLEVKKGQTATEARNLGNKVYENKVENQTQLAVIIEKSFLKIANDSKYAWYVEVLGVKGNLLGSSEVAVFSGANKTELAKIRNEYPKTGTTLTLGEFDQNIIFRWSNPESKNKEKVNYRLNFWGVPANENVAKFIQANEPNRQQQVGDKTEWPSLAAACCFGLGASKYPNPWLDSARGKIPKKGMIANPNNGFTVGWNVETLNDEGFVLTKSEISTIVVSKEEVPKAKDKRINLIYPSPYCPTTEKKPNFQWEDIDKPVDKANYTYSLKVVEMNTTDSTMDDFEKRKVVFEKENIKENSFKYPEKATELTMGKLYGWRVRKKLGSRIVSESEALPFYIIDYQLPFDASEVLCCKNGILGDIDFVKGKIGKFSDAQKTRGEWHQAYGNPILVTKEDGCGTPNYVRFSGSKEKGSAITQRTKIQKGKYYRLSACVRLCSGKNSDDYFYINAVANNEALPTDGKHPRIGSNVANVGWSGKIKNKEWITFSMPAWKANKNFENITIYVSSDSEKEMVCVDIDKICMQETIDSLSCDDNQYTTNGGLIIPDNLMANARNLDTTYHVEIKGKLKDLYEGYDGSASIYENGNQCSSIGGIIPDEVLKFNLDDSLKLIGINGGVAELEKILSTKIEDQNKQVTLTPIAPISASCSEFKPDPTQPFSGRDIIFVHGLNLSHLCELASGTPEMLWPRDKVEFQGKYGYFSKKALDTWRDHIQEWIRKRGFKNRVLVVAYNCSQDAEVAAHSILSQISDAMYDGKGVDIDLDKPTNTKCFGESAVIVSHSTGALVTDIAMSLAAKSKYDLNIQKKFGDISNIPLRIKAHVSMHGAIMGSQMATIFLASQGESYSETFAEKTACKGVNVDKNLMRRISFNSILFDLSPAVTYAKWKNIIGDSPVPTITIAGGHSLGTHEAIPFMNVAVHPGLDDGVVSMGSQSANPHLESNGSPVGFKRNFLLSYELFDLGINFTRAVHFFTNQTAFLTNFTAGASTPYLSPTGMLQPDTSIPSSTNPLNRLPNHFSFIQSASDHYLGPRGHSINPPENYKPNDHNNTSGYASKGYNYYEPVLGMMHLDPTGPSPGFLFSYKNTNYNSPTAWEESLVISDTSVLQNGLINPSVLNLPERSTRGKYLDFDVYGPQMSFKWCCKFKFWWGPMFHVRKTIWEREYELMSDSETQCEADYIYKYILR